MDQLLEVMHITLTLDQREQVIFWFAEGHTARYVKQQMLLTYDIELPDQEILKLAIAYADDITAVKDELLETTFQLGLIDKGLRIRKLSELADSWEAPAHSNAKAAAVYLKTLEQIQREAEPLGISIDVRLLKNDPWYKLYQRLQQVVEQTLNTDSQPLLEKPSE